MKKVNLILALFVMAGCFPLKKSKQVQYETTVVYRTMVCCDVVMQKGESHQNRKIFEDSALWHVTDSSKVILMNVRDWENGRDY